MEKLSESMKTLVEECALAETGKEMACGIVGSLQEKGIDAQEVLDRLYEKEPPYKEADIARAMQRTLLAHRKLQV